MLRVGVLILLAASGTGAVGCASTAGADGGVEDTSSPADASERGPSAALLDAEEHIARLSESERSGSGATAAARVVPGDVDLPPGIDPVALEMRGDDDARAWLGLADALEHVAARTDAFAPFPAPEPLDAERAEQALRMYARGRDLLLNDRPIEAINQFIRALQIDQGNPRIVRELARAYLTTGNETRAVALYEQLLHSDPDEELALFIVGLAAAEQRKFELAAATLGRPLLQGGGFGHDPNAGVIADFELARSLDALGYDRAFIDIARTTLRRLEQINLQTRYRRQIGSVYRRRAGLAQSLGDAQFRLGRVEEALSSYERASAVNGADLSTLLPRVIYANLALGNTFSAQRALLESMRGRFGRSDDDPRGATDRDAYLELLRADDGSSLEVGDREVLLCTYLRDTLDDAGLLGEAVNDLFTRNPDHPGLARAAASLLPGEQGLEALADFIARRPRDLNVVQQQLTWLGRRDDRAAVRLAVQLVEQHPDLAGDYTGRLAHAIPRPARAIEIARGLDASPAQARVIIGLYAQIGAVGHAWNECEAARQRWPEESSLALSRIRLAADLDEPRLVDEAIEAATRPGDASFLIAAAKALSRVDAHRRAIEAANEAVRLDPKNARAITAYAQAMAEYARVQTDDTDRAMWADDAVEAADQAIRLDPKRDEAYAVIASITGPAGLQPDLQEYNALKRRLAGEHPESRLAVLLDAQDDIAQRRYEAALERVVDLYIADPSDASSLALAVSAWNNIERLDDADAWFRDQLELRPGDPALLEYWTRVMLLKGDAAGAVAYLRREVEAHEDNHAAKRLLEASYRAAGEPAEMLALREARLLTRPRGTRREVDLAVAYAEAGRPEDALSRLQWVDAHVDEAREAHLTRAIETARALELDADVRDGLLTSLTLSTLDRFPGSALELYQIGLVALARLEDMGERFDDLARRAAMHAAGALDSTNEAILQWRRLAQALIEAGSADGAARALRARLQADPGFEQRSTIDLAVSTLGADAAATGNTVRSIELVEKLARHQIAEAGDDVQVDFDELVAETLYSISITYSIVGNDEGANRLLRKVLELDPDREMAMNNLGYTRIVAGHDDAETIALLEEAYRLGPEDPNILDSVGWLRYKQGVFADEDAPPEGADGTRLGALSLIRKALDRNQDPNPEVLDHLGDAYWRVGEHDRAVATWQKVARIVDDPERRNLMIQAYRLRAQLRQYGLVMKDPEIIYEREEGSLVGSLRAKIEAAEAGAEPPVAPTFEEMRQREAAGGE